MSKESRRGLMTLLASFVLLASESLHAEFRISAATYPPEQATTGTCQALFGASFRIADWNDIGSSLQGDLNAIMPLDTDAYVTRNGQATYSADRWYFVVRPITHAVDSGFLVHAQYGTDFFLGSWSGFRKVLCYASTTSASGFRISAANYPPEQATTGTCQALFGASFRIADWNDIGSGLQGDLNAIMPLDTDAYVTRNGQATYSTDRWYFVVRPITHAVGSGFLVHAQYGTDFFLGSWSGYRKVLCYAPSGTGQTVLFSSDGSLLSSFPCQPTGSLAGVSASYGRPAPSIEFDSPVGSHPGIAATYTLSALSVGQTLHGSMDFWYESGYPGFTFGGDVGTSYCWDSAYPRVPYFMIRGPSGDIYVARPSAPGAAGEAVVVPYAVTTAVWHALDFTFSPTGQGDYDYALMVDGQTVHTGKSYGPFAPNEQLVVSIGPFSGMARTYARYDNVRLEILDGTTSAPQILSFAGTPSPITVGQSATLSWSSTGGTSASISGIGSVPTTGSVTLSPMQTTTYTLTVTGAGGSTTRQTTVEVVPISDTCTPSASTMCLHGNRFELSVSWRDFAGRTGVGQVVPGAATSSGLFWFFQPDNWESMVKVLNGCAVNGHYWVMGAAATTVEYTLTVRDTIAGSTRSYSNPLGTAAAAIADTSAFSTCP